MSSRDIEIAEHYYGTSFVSMARIYKVSLRTSFCERL